MHIIFIQRLHAVGTSKDEIVRRALDAFPDFCKGEGGGKGATEATRTVRVGNAVEMHTSRWADSYI